MLQISNLSSGYKIAGGYVEILKNIDMHIVENEIVGIIGESGSGKTTLIKTIAGELYRNSGDIFYNGESIFSRSNFLSFRSKRIYVRQDSINILKPKYSVEFQIKKLYKGGKYDKMEVGWVFNCLNLSMDVMDMLPAQLSDGMKHKVVLAMASLMKPEILLLDEPTTGLDSSGIKGFLQLLKKLSLQTSIIIASNDIVPVFQLCHRIYIMKSGTLIEDGPWDEVLKNSHHPYTADLITYVPSIENKQLKYHSVDNGVDGGCVFTRKCRHLRDECRNPVPYRRDGEHGYRCVRYPGWIND